MMDKNFEKPWWAVAVWAASVAFGALVLSLLSTCAGAPRVVRVAVPVAGTGAINNAVVAAVEIDSACPGQVGARHGSGVIVGPDRVVTAFHVVPCTGGVALATTLSHQVIPMRVEAALVDADVARLIAVDREAFGDFRVEVGPPPAPEDVVCLAAATPSRSYSCGPVMSLKTVRADNTDYHTRVELDYRAKTEHGNSGSGIYDLRGRLVGIVTSVPIVFDLKGGSDYGCGTALRGIEWIARDWYGVRR